MDPFQGLQPLVEASGYAEDLPKSLKIADYVQQSALYKAKAVAERMKNEHRAFDLVIGCDTVISPDDILIIGKPKDSVDALHTLRSLNGKKHIVYSGVCLIGTLSS